MNDSNCVQQELTLMVEHFAGIEAGKVAFWVAFAKKLSDAVGRDQPWSWQYIRGVYKKQLPPGNELSKAIQVLGALIDSVPPIIAHTETIPILAKPGQVRPDSIVITSSRICAQPGCSIWFVPNSPRRKYCPACSPPKIGRQK